MEQPGSTTISQNSCLFRLPLQVFDTVFQGKSLSLSPGQLYKALQEKNKRELSKGKANVVELNA